MPFVRLSPTSLRDWRLVSYQFYNTDLARHAKIIQYYSQETTINMGYLFGDDAVGSPTMAPMMALRSLT